MTRRILLATGGLLLLVGATLAPETHNVKPAKEGELSSVVAAPAPAPAAKPAPAVAPAPRAVAQAGYPRCSATVTDRCIQGRGRAYHRAVPERRIQLASRAGERG
jgi:hypothetical protein